MDNYEFIWFFTHCLCFLIVLGGITNMIGNYHLKYNIIDLLSDLYGCVI